MEGSQKADRHKSPEKLSEKIQKSVPESMAGQRGKDKGDQREEKIQSDYIFRREIQGAVALAMNLVRQPLFAVWRLSKVKS